MRVSDRDRDHAAEELREHYALGRLTLDELQQRLDATYRSRTRADLAAVMQDLPTAAHAVPVSTDGRTADLRTTDTRDLGRRGRRHRPVSLAGYLRANGVCWSIWGVTAATASSHPMQGFWPLWVTVIGGIGLLSEHARQESSGAPESHGGSGSR